MSEKTQTLADTDHPQPSLKPLHNLLASDLEAVNAIILEHMQSPIALIPQLAGHIIAAGGKRLRPLLTLATARLAGYDGGRQLPLAACVEFMHTATLLHDDVVDESDLRRGQETAKAIWGNKASVLVGDFLIARAFQLMVADGSLKVLKILSTAAATIAEGEVFQLLTSNDTKTSQDAYMNVIRAKTAALFEAACLIGGVVSDCDAKTEQALASFGTNLGIAFQLADDIIDYISNAEALGKTQGDDFREGKITLPVVLAFARSSGEEKFFWKKCLEDLDQDKKDFQTALTLMEKYDAIEDSKALAFEYADKAVSDLDSFPDTPIRKALIEATRFSVDRLY